jgi:hypothetical protein
MALWVVISSLCLSCGVEGRIRPTPLVSSGEGSGEDGDFHPLAAATLQG